MRVLKACQLIFNSLLIIALCFQLFSCNKNDRKKSQTALKSIHIQSSKYIINPKSLKIVSPGRNNVPLPARFKAKTPVNITANFNTIKVSNLRNIVAGKPKENIPGMDTFSSPESFAPIIQSYPAGIPELVLVKEPDFSVQNPKSICTYGKFQGLKDGSIHCMIQDKMGCVWFGTYAGASKYDGKYFSNYTEAEGLSNNTVLSMIQDKNGCFWFGTDGGGVSQLSSDGKIMMHISLKEGINNSIIWSILQDQKGQIWFGTDGGGVFKLDNDGKTITQYTEKEGLCGGIVISIIEDHNRNLWFGTNKGVSKFNGKSFVNYTEKEGLINNRVWSIFEQKNGIIWFGTEEGISRFNGKSFSNFGKDEGFSNHLVAAITQDHAGNIWFGYSEWGLLKFDGKYFEQINQKDGLPNNIVKSLIEDNTGNLWIGTNSGVGKYYGYNFSHITGKEGLPNSNIWSIIQDNAGNYWFSSDFGITRYDGKYFNHFSQNEGLPINCVKSLFMDSKGNLWIGTWGGGVCKYDGEFFTYYTKENGLTDNVVLSILEDRNGNIWFGTERGGVSMFDGMSFTNFSVKEGLSNNKVWCIIQDRTGNLFFGTDGGGITILSSDANSFSYFSIKDGLINNKVYSIVEDHVGNFWCGTNEGITIIASEDKTGKNKESKFEKWKTISLSKKDGLSDNTIFNLLFDKEGNLFIGTGKGLNIIDFQNLKTIEFLVQKLKQPGFPLFKNFLFEDGFLGQGVNEGKTMYQSKDGNIWIAANNRLTIYHPKGDKTNTFAPNIQLTGLEIFSESFNWEKLLGKVKGTTKTSKLELFAKDTIITLGNGIEIKNFNFNDLTAWYNLPKNLSLAYNNNFITFNYIGITQKYSKKVKYQYKLEGFDENWSGITNRTSAPYGNLPHGNFTFKVKAMTSDGFWSDEVSYSFSIRPPWWRTKVFTVLAILLIILGLILIYRWRLTNLRKQKKKLEILVAEKTVEVINQNKELKSLNDEQEVLNEELVATNEELYSQREELMFTVNSLQETQKQLIQSEKMASLGILAAGVAHEINNPLNFIQSGAMALENYFDEHFNEHLDKIAPMLNGIQVGVSRAAKIVTSLNHYSRHDDTKMIDCNIHEIIDNCLVMLYNQTKSRIEIEKKYHSEPFIITGIESKLHQAMLNILANAVQSIENEGTIKISTLIENDVIKIAIQDSGSGISKQDLPKIYDPFFTTKDPGKGTGLGLSITYSIIKEHNGSIEFESQIEVGTKVLIKLPIKMKESRLNN